MKDTYGRAELERVPVHSRKQLTNLKKSEGMKK
jgi:hypothetical protein